MKRLQHEGLAELLSGRHDLIAVVSAGVIDDANDNVANALLTDIRTLAAREHFLHWPTAFPGVWSDPDPNRRGFDAIIGNPPWDRIKLQEVEWFAERRAAIAQAVRAADRKTLIAALRKQDDPLWREYLEARDTAETAARVFRECGDYPLLSGGDINLYSLFVERAEALIHARGMVGLLTPSGIAADKGAAEFFRGLTSPRVWLPTLPLPGMEEATSSNSENDGARLAALYDFENKKIFFPDIHASFKFCALVFGGTRRRFKRSRCAFYLHAVAELAADKVLDLSAEDFMAVNPNTGAAPIFRTRRDADLTLAIYRRQPVLVDRRATPPHKLWPLRYVTMFHMTNDSALFKRREELERDGWYPVAANRWKKGEAEAVPLYVGRMVHQYDHRSASVTVNEENLHNAAFSGEFTLQQKGNPDAYPAPQYWIAESDLPEDQIRAWALGFRDIARATDARTMIAAIVPTVAAGNTLPLLVPDSGFEDQYHKTVPLLLANLNAMIFDYIARQKTQSTHLNWYIVEQLPLIRPEQFEASIGAVKIADFVRDEVLRLSYTAHDLAPFARDLGYDGAPFRWDEDDRRHRQARLDALFFLLYGIDRPDGAYILDQFPIVREQDIKTCGRYITQDLILAYMNALAAGDLASTVRTS